MSPQESDPPRCTRCGALTIADLLVDQTSSVPCWRCVMCGNRQEALIQHHHAYPMPPKTESHPRLPGDHAESSGGEDDEEV